MAITVELPHVGESVVEGTIGKWLKQPGDSVRRYEPLVEVVTDKVTMEVPSPVEGELLRLLAAEGETLPMGAPIAEVGDPGETPSSAAPTATPATAPAATPDPMPAPPASVGTTGYLMRDVTPVGPTGGAAVEAAEPMVGVGVQPAHSPAPPVAPPVQAASAVATTQASPPSRDGGPRLSPAVRRLAREHSVDLTRIQGTGMGGRITRDDVLKFLAEPQPAAVPAAAPPAAVPTAPAAPAPVAPGPDEERVPLTPVRRMIAEAMVRSVTEIPHAWSTKEVDVSGLVALRQSVRAGFEQQEGVSLTFMPFVIRAVVEALRKVPTMNASWGGDSIILKRRINLGLAVAAPNGLIVPVVHNADRLTVTGLAHAVADLTERARSNRLTIEDVQGGTFTLNNTGALGRLAGFRPDHQLPPGRNHDHRKHRETPRGTGRRHRHPLHDEHLPVLRPPHQRRSRGQQFPGGGQGAAGILRPRQLDLLGPVPSRCQALRCVVSLGWGRWTILPPAPCRNRWSAWFTTESPPTPCCSWSTLTCTPRGRLSRDEHLLSAEGDLAAFGARVYETDRGGQVTYHGPGQLVGYPVLNLRHWGGGPLQYVRTLEQVIVDTLADFGIAAHTEPGLTGVWTSAGKVAAIGVKISRGVSFHGFSLNINTDLAWYRHIVPCGISDRPVTSMAQLLGEDVDPEAVRYSLVYRFGRAMGMRMEKVSPSEIVVSPEGTGIHRLSLREMVWGEGIPSRCLAVSPLRLVF